jgi:hypothetical protein
MRTPTLIFLLSLTACASLRPGPFQSFETSVATAQKGLETEMARDVQWTREADVEALAETKDAPLGDHMLKETKGYAWSTAVTAPHWEARLTLRALEELNAAFLGYANLLTQVAEGQPALSKEHEALSAAINLNLREAAEMLVQTKKTPALFPAGAAALSSESLLRFQWFGRARNLRKALMENQPWVEEFAAHCLRLIDLIRVDLKTAYGDRMAAIHDRWDDKRTPGRNTLARSIFNLNAEFSDAMVALKALSLFYNGLPAAHQDLADGLGRKAKPQQALAQLATFAERVARLTKDLEKAR